MNPPNPNLNELGDDLRTLKRAEGWSSFGDLALQLLDHWRKNLSRFSMEDSVEKIAKDRIRYTSMIAGVEALFDQMETLIKDLEEKEKERDRSNPRSQ